MTQNPYYPDSPSDKSTARGEFPFRAGSSQFPKSAFFLLQPSEERATKFFLEEGYRVNQRRWVRRHPWLLKLVFSDFDWKRVCHLRKWIGPR